MSHAQPAAHLGRSSRPLSPVNAALRAPLVALPWSVMLALLLAWWGAPQLLERAVFVPLLLSVVLLGLPHGALDHLVPGRLGWRWGTRFWPVLAYCLGYAALAGLYLLAWRWVPLAAYGLFLLLSLLHWGQGDLRFLEQVLERRRRAPAWALVGVLARGSLPILVPLLAQGEWFSRLGAAITQAFGGEAVGWALPSGVLFGAAVLLGALLGAYVWDTLRSARDARAGALELAEVALLLVVFVWVPAPLSIGLYFACWHAWRHLGRLLALDADGAREVAGGHWVGRHWVGPVLRLARGVLPLTLVSLAALGALYGWAAPRVTSLEAFTGLYLSLIAALTLPHALLVACMDWPWFSKRARRRTFAARP